MIEFKECNLKDIIHFSEYNCDLKLLNTWYKIYLNNVLIGTFGYVYTRALDIDRIVNLCLVIDKKYRNKGLFSNIAKKIKDKLIENSRNNKIWVMTRMLSLPTKYFSSYFGFINLNNNNYYLYHNTKGDNASILFANETIKIFNKIEGK